MAENIDAEILISLIEARPVLWDKTLDIFKDKNATRSAWREVCLELQPNFEELEDGAKNSFAKDVIKRWTNLRDAFAKSNKKIKEIKTSGSGGKIPKKYVFNDQLQFLKKLYDGQPTNDNFDENAGEECVPDTGQNMSVAAAPTLPETTQTKDGPTRAKKRPKLDEFELKILKALEPEKPNSKLSFLQSLLPHLDKYDDDDMLEFKMGVLELIVNINKKKKMASDQPSSELLAQTSNNVSQPHSFPFQSVGQYYHMSPGFTSQEGYARNTSTPFSSGSSTSDSNFVLKEESV